MVDLWQHDDAKNAALSGFQNEPETKLFIFCVNPHRIYRTLKNIDICKNDKDA